MSIIVPTASFKTTLTQRLAASGTTAYIDTTTDDSGNDLNGLVIAVTINKGNSNEETIIGTVNTATLSLTTITRNVDVSDGTTAGTGKDHRKKSSVEITSFPYLTLALRALNGTDTLDNLLQYTTELLPTDNKHLATKKYADDLAIAGAPDATESVKGLNEMATAAESIAGTDTGSTTGPLVVTPFDIALNQQNQAHNYAADTGAADAYAIAMSPAVTAYAAGQRFVFLATNANTGASTLDVDSLGVKTILKLNDQALEANDIEAGHLVEVVYNGTQFEMQTPLASGLTTAIASETSTFFGATDITGAEAETLTDGSDADALHAHNTLVRGFNLNVMMSDDGTGSNFSASAYSDADGDTPDLPSFTIAHYTTSSGARKSITTWQMSPDIGGSLYMRTNETTTTGNALHASSSLNLEGGVALWEADSADANIAKNETDVTVSGTAPSAGGILGHDPTNSYLLIMDSTTRIRRYSGIAGTTITFVDSITLDTAITQTGFIFDNTNSRYICLDTTANVVRRFDSSGTTIDTVAYTVRDNDIIGCCFVDDRVYLINARFIDPGTIHAYQALYDLIPTSMTR